MSTKEDKNRSGNALKCCQSNDSITSVNVNNASDVKTKTSPFLTSLLPSSPSDAPNNNNKKMCDMKSEHHFPKRQTVDLEFQNITFTSWSWSMTRFQKGNIPAFI